MRLLELREDNGRMAMAVEEAILIARSKDIVPDTFRLFKFKPSCVSIGYFQSYDAEIYDEKRKELGIDAVRRITGGGAVYHDYNGEITYSVIMSEKNIASNIQKSYEKICSGLVNSLHELGLDASFKPINDILVGNKKISGSAQTRKHGVVLQHGTLMYNTDIKTLFSVLNVSKEKMADKILKSIEERVTTVSQQKGPVGPEEVISAMEKGFEKTFGKFERSKLTKEELEIAKGLYDEKYNTENWLKRR